MSVLQQLNIQYLPVEDRLKLRIRFGDDSEVALWLTRRFAKLLLATLDRITQGETKTPSSAVSSEAQKAIAEFQREAATRGNDYETAYQEGSSHPLGEEALLAIKLEYAPLKNGMIRLGLGTQTGKMLNINLDQKTIHTLSSLVLMGTQKAEWDLGDPADTPLEKEHKAATKSLH